MRSVHTEASTQDQSRSFPVSAPCVAKAGTAGAVRCLVTALSHPPSYPPSLSAVLLPARLAAHRRCGTMRALTPARRSHVEQASSLNPLCLPDIQPPTTSCARTLLSQPPQLVRSDPLPGPGFAVHPRRLAATRRRYRFVILQATRSPPVAPHPARADLLMPARRRSYLRLHVLWLHMAKTPTLLTIRTHERTGCRHQAEPAVELSVTQPRCSRWQIA